MTNTAATATKITYRKTKTGEWVAFGPADYFVGINALSCVVTKKDGTRKTEQIDRLGRPFSVDGVEMVYAYLLKSAPRPQRGGCPTGGNCSSFGTGRSCGAHDCDGY